MKINIWTIAGGAILLGGAYLALRHFGYWPQDWPGGAPVRMAAIPGYTEQGYGAYQGNVLPAQDFQNYDPYFHAPSNSSHQSSIRPPG